MWVNRPDGLSIGLTAYWRPPSDPGDPLSGHRFRAVSAGAGRRYPCPAVAKANSTLRLGLFGAVLAALMAAGAACADGGEKLPPVVPSGGAASKLPPALALSRGRVFFVARNGDNAGPGTRGRPWRTVQHAFDRLRPGQRALVRGGTYVHDLVAERSGTARAPITVAAYPGERVVLRAGSRSGDTYPLQITSGAAYLRVSGFVIEGAKGTSSTNIYFAGRAHHVEVSGNEIRYSQDQGIFAEASTSNLQILRNRIHDNGRGHESGQHQSHGIYIEGRNHLIANNVINRHPYGFGIQIYPENTGTIVVSNTIVHSGLSGIVVGGDEGVGNITIRNNILAFNSGYGVEADSACPVSPVLVDTNVLYRNGDGGVEKSCNTVNSGSGNISADPRFVSRSGGNLQLSSGSGAVDRARGDYSPRVDIRGRRRPRGAGYDVGAFERG
jgi:Right handed beta helix region